MTGTSEPARPGSGPVALRAVGPESPGRRGGGRAESPDGARGTVMGRDEPLPWRRQGRGRSGVASGCAQGRQGSARAAREGLDVREGDSLQQQRPHPLRGPSLQPSAVTKRTRRGKPPLPEELESPWHRAGLRARAEESGAVPGGRGRGVHSSAGEQNPSDARRSHAHPRGAPRSRARLAPPSRSR